MASTGQVPTVSMTEKGRATRYDRKCRTTSDSNNTQAQAVWEDSASEALLPVSHAGSACPGPTGPVTWRAAATAGDQTTCGFPSQFI